jgi:ubiquinone/menaquinone biosynthesis C-methylase UbiE
MSANYNNSAWFYDKLSALIYGRALIDAQVYLLHFIPANANILIVGGGTGRILEEITQIHPSGLEITYVEIAVDMMTLSKRRNTGRNEVVFINDAIENVSLPAAFDIVITAFLFDNFNQQTLTKIFVHLHTRLKTNGLWLNADFQLTGKWWQSALLKLMFLFFKIVCNIEATQLPDICGQFEEHGYEVVAEKMFFGDFVISRVYVKSKTYEVSKTS